MTSSSAPHLFFLLWMPYNDVQITYGSRRENYIIFQCLPTFTIDRIVKTPAALYWYLIKFPTHRRQTIQHIASKWKGEVNTVYLYHYSLPIPLAFDPRWTDAQFLTILRILFQRETLQPCDIGIPTFFNKEINESIIPF